MSQHTAVGSRSNADRRAREHTRAPAKPETPPGRGRGGFGVILAGSVLMFAVLDGGLRLLPRTGIDNTLGRIGIMGVMLGVALVIERVAFRRGPRAALLALGHGRPTPRSLVVAVAVSAMMLAYFPVAILGGASLRLESNWLWLVVGAIAVNGIGEETLFRGFAFGHLRAGGRSFVRATLLSMVIFVAAHVFLFIDNHPAVAGMSILVAVAWAFPLAYLFERGGSTIWAPAILHVASHGVRFFDDPSMLVLMGWMLFQVAAPFLVFLFRRYLSAEGDTPQALASLNSARMVTGGSRAA